MKKVILTGLSVAVLFLSACGSSGGSGGGTTPTTYYGGGLGNTLGTSSLSSYYGSSYGYPNLGTSALSSYYGSLLGSNYYGSGSTYYQGVPCEYYQMANTCEACGGGQYTYYIVPSSGYGNSFSPFYTSGNSISLSLGIDFD